MALSPIQVKPKQPSGGGLFGKIFGTLAGGIAGAFAGNPLGGAKAGAALGGMVDAARSGGNAPKERAVPLSTVAEKDPEVQRAQLLEGQKALMESTQIPMAEKEEAMAQLSPALSHLDEILKKRRA